MVDEALLERKLEREPIAAAAAAAEPKGSTAKICYPPATLSK